MPTMKVTRHEADERFHTVFACMECGEPIGATDVWWDVDGDAVCDRPDCGPAYAELASPEGQERLRQDRIARPAQYR